MVVKAIVVRYLTLIGLLLSVGWIVRSHSEWEPWTVFVLTLVAYIGTDLYAASHGQLNLQNEGTDHRLFRKLLQELPSDGSIGFIKDANMAGFSFRADRLHQLDQFWHQWTTADREFKDKRLEAQRKELYSRVDAYMKCIGTNTFPARNQGFQTVPPEWEVEQPERFAKVVEELHSLAGRVVEAHQQLVRLGSHRLGVSSIA